jgi:hypothetical protein
VNEFWLFICGAKSVFCQGLQRKIGISAVKIAKMDARNAIQNRREYRPIHKQKFLIMKLKTLFAPKIR